MPEAAPGGEAYGGKLSRRMKDALDTKEPTYVPRTHHLNDDGSPTFTNRLVLESSPYLLQHAHNPVDWRPWGEEAFEAARELDRPILLSIGYSTCHWCHVMERESFEDVEIATYMNENFVCIKVDREERPDVDAVYMDAVRALTGRGGWPMTTALTPDREVFFGGTYFPARDGDRGARIGFLTILSRLSAQYADNRDEIVAQAKQLTDRLRMMAERDRAGDIPGPDTLRAAVTRLSKSFDDVYGGFGRAPKFPRSVTLDMLMRYARRADDPEALHMATYTLERMAAGGMYDQVGGGFHRYSVDAKWLVPHFEKMLYDNAQLAATYLEAFQITENEDFARIVTEILDYVLLEMTDPSGGFYSATDADSLTPNGHEEEGWYFTWTPAEIAALVEEEATLELLRAYYGITEKGNFEGRNILFAKRNLSRVASDSGMEPEDAREKIDAARAVLYAERSLRPPPGKDTKILTSWNGLMISALARAGFVLERSDYIAAAAKAADLLLDKMWDGRSLRRALRLGRARHEAVLDDYAFLIAGLLDLFEAEGNPRWLEAALALMATTAERFWDSERGGFFFTANDAEELLVRDKPTYDGAEPSGNAVSVHNLLRLYEFIGDDQHLAMAEGALRGLSRAVAGGNTAAPRLLSALDFYLDTPKEIVLVRPHPEDDFGPFVKRLAKTYLPNRVVIKTTQGEAADKLGKIVPLVSGKKALEDRVTAYVCENRVCDLPTNEPAKFAEQIARVSAYANP